MGYPNVGKSSTLNALMGAHKVAVGATPGKTKHFQTFHLDESMILCDCPGLVFPSFATTKADMVCNGILPIDQMREYLGPSGLVAQRIPREIVEAVYGIQIRLFANDVESLVLSKEKKTDERAPTAEELLIAFALARGFTKASQGNPDESRAARHILKDYVQGKLLFVHPPPGVDAKEFNAALYKSERYIAKKKKEAELAMKEELALASGHKVYFWMYDFVKYLNLICDNRRKLLGLHHLARPTWTWSFSKRRRPSRPVLWVNLFEKTLFADQGYPMPQWI